MADDASGPFGFNALTGSSRYRLGLAAMSFPLAGYLFFNGLAALCVALIGHPVFAVLLFLSETALDAIQQAFARRWQATADGVSETDGLRRLGAMAAVRGLAALIPFSWLVIAGGFPEMLLFSVQFVAWIAIGVSMGALSRGVFWGYLAPMLVSLGVIAVARLEPMAGGGVTLALLCAVLVLWNISRNTNRLMDGSRDEFEAKRRLVADLEVARDEARHANRAKSNFLATMSHEIRTPMNGVLGMAQLLKRDEADPRQRERIDVLIDSGEYLLSILNDILDVSKIDAGKLDLAPTSEDVRLFLTRLVGFWGARADEQGVALELQVSGSVPDHVLVDALRLRQVLFNLVGNALKFTEQGVVEISADARPDGNSAVVLCFSVRDTGPGIAPEHLPMLFDRFSQADPSEVRKYGGTGLGLAIARQLVELMDGRIWAESELGRGSTFHIELPLPVAEAGAPAASEAAEAEPPGLDALRVLAVDDNAVNLLVLDQLLTSLGCQVAKAAGGAEALDLLACEAFDIVLMDIQMPGMSGVEALQRLRAAGGPNAGAPVVALTADVTSGGRQRYLDLGFDDHSSKPIQIEALMNTMAQAMTRPRRAAQAA